MRIRKKLSIILSLLFTFTSLTTLSASAYDNSNQLELLHSNYSILEDCCSSCNEIDPQAIVSCNSSPSGQHEMFSRGFGTLYRGTGPKDPNKELIFMNKAAWQCPYCYVVIVSQGEVARGEALGKYGMSYPGYETSHNGTVLYTPNIYNSSSSTLQGFNFRY